ncbi:hypothetical protein N7456_004510 [Penicillium angulare]|uniref:N-acetyltransferase domain-containing protein n=1 Tax=Penicillium angulare TaxID=116970 RepID=A0A9W9KIM3_9EURO|nr:hypothetical protein N7456_004510 [Penicillium angulare]
MAEGPISEFAVFVKPEYTNKAPPGFDPKTHLANLESTLDEPLLQSENWHQQKQNLVFLIELYRTFDEQPEEFKTANLVYIANGQIFYEEPTWEEAGRWDAWPDTPHRQGLQVQAAKKAPSVPQTQPEIEAPNAPQTQPEISDQKFRVLIRAKSKYLTHVANGKTFEIQATYDTGSTVQAILESDLYEIGYHPLNYPYRDGYETLITPIGTTRLPCIRIEMQFLDHDGNRLHNGWLEEKAVEMASYQVKALDHNKDVVALSKNNMSAFWSQTWWRMLWIDKPLNIIIDNCILRMPQSLQTDRAVRRHEKVIDSATGGIVGYARWILPESHSGSWIEAQIPDVTVEESKAFAANFNKADWTTRSDMPGIDDPLHKMMNKHTPKKPHIKLDYLAVNPEYWRQGIGSRLVESGIEQANKLGLEIFLVAMGKNALGMYRKLGFEFLEQDIQDLSPWGFDDVYDTYILLKQPQAAF